MKRFITVFSVGLVLVLSACETQSNVEEDLASDSTRFRSEVDQFAGDADTRLAGIDNDIQILETRLETATANVKDDLQETLAEAREKRDKLAVMADSIISTDLADRYYDLKEDWEETYHEVDEELAEAKLEAAETRDDFKTDLQKELDELDQEIAEKREDMEILDDTVRAPFEGRLAVLEQRRDEFKAELDSLGNKTEEGWKDLKSEMIKGWDEMKNDLATVRIPEESSEGNELDEQQR